MAQSWMAFRTAVDLELYLLDKCPQLVQTVRIQFRKREPESSAGSFTHPYHILHWDSFLKTPIEIPVGEMGELIELMPTDWARAFIQPDLGSITKQLCIPIFNRANIQKHGVGKLGQVVQWAAAWMATKETEHLDPWTYPFLPPPIFCHSEEVQRVISEYTNEAGAGESAYGPEFDVGLNNLDCVPAEEVVVPRPCGDDTFENVVVNCLLKNEMSEEDQLLTNEHIYTSFVRHLKGKRILINGAQAAAALTKVTVPDNTDIFVDAYQVSNNRWTLAAAQQQIGDIAVKLFNKVYHTDFANSPERFNGVSDICPVKLLAIYRGSKYLNHVWEGSVVARTSDFDSRIREHNMFPTKEERQIIDEALTRRGWELRDIKLFGEARARPEFVMKGDHQYEKPVWDEAQTRYEEYGSEKAGKYLYKRIFDDEERKYGSPTGKNGTKILKPEKVASIMDAMKYMEANIIVRHEIEPWSESRRKLLFKKVITETSSQERARLNLKPPQN